MKLAIHTASLADLSFEDGLRVLQGLGIDSVELGVAGYFADDLRYGDPARLLASDTAFTNWRDAYRRHGLEINALAVHGEPLHPDPEAAAAYAADFAQACTFAEKLGVERITALAGLPEAAPGDDSPSWIVSLPAEFRPPNPQALTWQWQERVLPYWRDQAQVAVDHGCQLCFEMRAWDVVYNPRTLLELREAIGPAVGALFDPSHLIPQRIDPCAAIHALGEAIYAVHIKDTRLEPERVRINGVLDVNPTQALGERAWTFATPGYGSDERCWREMVAALRHTGYDRELTIEYEDFFMPPSESVAKAVELMRPIAIEGPPAQAL